MIRNEEYNPRTFAGVLGEWRKDAIVISERLEALIGDIKADAEQEASINEDLAAAKLTAIALEAERLAEGLRALRSHARYIPNDAPPAPLTGTISIQQLGNDWRAKTHLHLVPNPVEGPNE